MTQRIRLKQLWDTRPRRPAGTPRILHWSVVTLVIAWMLRYVIIGALLLVNIRIGSFLLSLILFSLLWFIIGTRVGSKFERWVGHLLHKEQERPWVPVQAVEKDVARALGARVEEYVFRQPNGDVLIDHDKVAEIACAEAAQSAVRRRRSAHVRRLMEREQ